MAGVNLSEESDNILATNSGLVGAVTHSCKDEAFLSCAMLQRRMLEIGETPAQLWLYDIHPAHKALKCLCFCPRSEVWGDRPRCRCSKLCLPCYSAATPESARKGFASGPAEKRKFQGSLTVLFWTKSQLYYCAVSFSFYYSVVIATLLSVARRTTTTNRTVMFVLSWSSLSSWTTWRNSGRRKRREKSFSRQLRYNTTDR